MIRPPAAFPTHIGLAACSCICLAAVVSAQPSQGPPAARVVVDAARSESAEQMREVTGELRAARRAMVASQETGVVVELPFSEGDPVVAGDVIARLDDRLARFETARAAAAVEAQQGVVAERAAELERAARDLSRLEDLLARASASENEVENARTDVARVSARLEQARAELLSREAEYGTAQKRLEDMTVEAPFDGRIVALGTEVGQWLARGDTVLELVSLSEVEAWLSVPERFIGRLTEPGLRVRVLVPALRMEVDAPIAGVIPAADPLSRIFPVRVRLADPEQRMRPGMSVTGLAPTGEHAEVLTVHKDAVLRDDAGAYLYFDSAGTAQVARLEILFPVGDRVAVRAPRLEAGAMVVVEGNERLFPSQPLTIVDAPARGSGGSGGSGGAGHAGAPAGEGGERGG